MLSMNSRARVDGRTASEQRKVKPSRVNLLDHDAGGTLHQHEQLQIASH